MDLLESLAFQVGAVSGQSGTSMIDQSQARAQSLVTGGSIVIIPIKMQPLDENVLAAWGVKSTRHLDKWLQECETPAGWKTESTGHSMWNNLLDERGRVRATYFYKSTFGFVEDAFFGVKCRYSAGYIKDDWDDRGAPYIPVVKDSNGKILWRGTPVPSETQDQTRERYAMRTKERNRLEKLKRKVKNAYERSEAKYPDPTVKATRDAEAVLLAHAPEAHSALAYWDADIDFGPSLSEVTPGERYKLITRCYSRGQYQDGGEHFTCLAVDDAKAIERAMASMSFLRSHYDEVQWTLKTEAGRMVKEGTECKPRPRVTYYNDYEG